MNTLSGQHGLCSALMLKYVVEYCSASHKQKAQLSKLRAGAKRQEGKSRVGVI